MKWRGRKRSKNVVDKRKTTGPQSTKSKNATKLEWVKRRKGTVVGSKVLGAQYRSFLKGRKGKK